MPVHAFFRFVLFWRTIYNPFIFSPCSAGCQTPRNVSAPLRVPYSLIGRGTLCARQPIIPTTLWGLNSPALQTLFSACPSHQETAGANCPGCPFLLRQYRTIPALRLKHRSSSCGTASALPKCSIMSGCGTRIVLRGQKPLALCDRCPCIGSLFPPLAALTFAASSIICAFGLAAASPRSPYRHLELCGIAQNMRGCAHQ